MTTRQPRDHAPQILFGLGLAAIIAVAMGVVVLCACVWIFT